MTPFDAAALAVLGARDRRLGAALLRAVADRSTAEDLEALPPRAAGEPLLRWACRCRTPSSELDAEVARVSRIADEQLRAAARFGAVPVPLGDPRFPACLAAIPDPPPLLWTRGQPSAHAEPGVAIVGSRAATPYALSMARHLAGGLADAGVVVVSGLARGVDSSAHQAVVSAGGRTVGVLGCGIDRVYPAEHEELARDITREGAVVSEFPPGVLPLKYHFPLRNRIISGLSLAVVVVEAPEKSGALITASAAAEQGRDVMVVPGQALGGRNRGGHLLIRDGAKVVERVDDILNELSGLTDKTPGSAAPAIALPEGTEFTADDVVAQMGAPVGVVLARLLELELAGKIQRIGGGRFVRVLT